MDPTRAGYAGYAATPQAYPAAAYAFAAAPPPAVAYQYAMPTPYGYGYFGGSDRNESRDDERDYYNGEIGPVGPPRDRAPPKPGKDGKGPDTLFISNLPPELIDDRLEQELRARGVERFHNLIIKRQPDGKSKGYCFLEFEHHEEAEDARVKLNAWIIDGKSISVKWAEFQRLDEEALAKVRVVYVSGLPGNTTEDDMRGIFLKFGALEKVTVPRKYGEPNVAKGFAFIDFVKREDAVAAVKEVNGSVFKGGRGGGFAGARGGGPGRPHPRGGYERDGRGAPGLSEAEAIIAAELSGGRPAPYYMSVPVQMAPMMAQGYAYTSAMPMASYAAAYPAGVDMSAYGMYGSTPVVPAAPAMSAPLPPLASPGTAPPPPPPPPPPPTVNAVPAFGAMPRPNYNSAARFAPY
eukprot:tig00001155_g7332.t1